MYSGSFERRRAFSSSTRSLAPARVGHDVGDEALVAGRVLAREDDRLAHRRMRADRGLDLAQLDAEAADLDLVVDAAEVLEIAVRQPARQVAGPVQPPAGVSAKRVRHEPLGGQLRAVQVPAGDAGAADVDLPRHADRHGLPGGFSR